MKNYKCIIFDCDGVLVDSEILGNQVFVDLANEYGASINLEYALAHFKGSYLKECIRQVEVIIAKQLPENFETIFRERSVAKFKHELQPIAGIEQVLKELRIPFCTASSGPVNKIVENLKTTGLYAYFEENIFSCYTIKKWKPEPDIYLLAAETMGFNVEECLVIEDSLTGVMAAKNGGFDVFGFDSESSGMFEAICTKTFSSMTKLTAMLKQD